MANSTSRIARGRLFTSTLLAGAAALGMPAAVGVAVSFAPSVAMAQDYTSGTLSGTVSDNAGAAVAGAKVTVRSQSTGVSQTSTTNAQGGFRAPLIPSGSYTVSIAKDGFASTTQSDLHVGVGGDSSYAFTLLAAGGDVSEVVVVAKKAQPQLDFSRATKGISIDVEELQKQLPIARNVTAVALLAPGVVTSVPGFTNTDGTTVPSIGGGSAGENSYYINGLNITNFDTYIGGATVPFDFYKTVEIKTGGYPAEFGRATGGVINAVTKSGTNDFYFGIHGDYQPDFVRSNAPNQYNTNNARTRVDNSATNVEFGGPILKDHLFFYGLYQLNHTIQEGASNTGGTFYKQRDNSPFYGFKLDGYLTARQHLEFTQFSTADTIFRNTFGFTSPVKDFKSPNNGAFYVNGGDGQGTLGPYVGSTVYKNGGTNYVGKYTGTFTDWLTVSAAYGKNHDRNYTLPGTGQVPYVQDARLDGTLRGFGPVPAANASTSIDTTAREFFRGDVDLYVEFLGKHHFRGGYDHEETRLTHTLFLSGGGEYSYFKAQSPEEAASYGFSDPNQEYLLYTGEVLGAGGTPVHGENAAFYIQDSWDVTRNLNINVGIRDDIFKLSNLRGQQVLDLDGNWGPRVALSYDPFGHKTDKFTISYGRYFIPPASNLSFRGADFGGSEYFLPPNGAVSYNGYIDPVTKAPTNLGTPITNPAFTEQFETGVVCPTGFPVTGVAACSLSYGPGIQEPADTKAAKNLEATHEDEIIVGYQKKLNSLWTVGATVTYRNLGNASEDIDNLGTAIASYCVRNPSHTGCNLGTDNIVATFNALGDYKLINPGEHAVVTVRPDEVNPDTGLKSPLAGQTFDLSVGDLGFPKAKREYYGLELTFDRAFDGKWSLSGSYTLSKSIGNYEGTVKSDAGNSAQTDAGSTEEFDYPGLEDYTYGLLPNHRAHQFKLYGSYLLFDGLSLGANVNITSPRHYGCIGYYPYPTNAGGYGGVDPVAAGYGNASRYCYSPTLGYSVPTPRGDSFTGDWVYQIDLSLRYAVPKITKYMPGNLVLRVDAFNIINSQQVLQYSEVGNSTARSVSGTYQFPIAYQTPRYVRFGFDLTF